MLNSDLTIILQATGLSESLSQTLLQSLNLPENLTFVDFLLYIPFFMKVHQYIIEHLFNEASLGAEGFMELIHG
jgi:hypothetical protein